MNNLLTSIKSTVSKMVFSFSMILFSGFTFAANTQGEDIVKLLIGGSLGKSIGKDGMIWGVLTVVSFVGAGFWAALKSDPKQFIPAFITAGIISTVVGVFITF